MGEKKLIFREGFTVKARGSRPQPFRAEIEVALYEVETGDGFSTKAYELVTRHHTKETHEILDIEELIVHQAVTRLMEWVNTVNHDQQEVFVWETNQRFKHHNGYCEFCSRWFTEFYGVVALKKKCPSCHRMTRCLNTQKVSTQAKHQRWFVEQRGSRLYRGRDRRYG